MAETIQWREPGPSIRSNGGGRGVWLDRLQPLVSHPGRWAMVHTVEVSEGAKSTPAGRASTVAAQLRSRKTRIPDGKWEFTSRQAEVYARYIGPE